MRKSLILLALAALLLAAPLASAHKTVYTSDDKFKLTFGFLNEPAVTWTKTGIDLIITDNVTGGPVDGADKTLNASLVYGDQSRDLALKPQFGTHGRYTDVITMTRPGLYKLHLVGKVNGTTVDVLIPQVEATPDIKTQATTPATVISQTPGSSTPASSTPATKPAPGFEPVMAFAVLGVVALLVLRRRD
jgi:MYXO-CTERM domain-containing protein